MFLLELLETILHSETSASYTAALRMFFISERIVIVTKPVCKAVVCRNVKRLSEVLLSEGNIILLEVFIFKYVPDLMYSTSSHRQE